MSKIEVNKLIPQSGTDVQLGESGDTITIPAGATITNNGTANGFGSADTEKVKVSSNDTTAGLTNGQNVRILVTNPDGNAARSSSDLTVSDGPVFTTTSLPDGAAGTSYSQSIDVTGDSAVTISQSVVSGSLPPGITIGTTSTPSGSTYRAVISGTLPSPASETTYSFTVRATDAQGQTTDQALSIKVTVGIQNAGGFC